MPRFCNRRWKPCSNRFIIGDAITPENATKLIKTCASEYGALLWQKFVAYRCTSTFSDLNNCDGTFFKSLSYLYEVVRTIFPADFCTFRNFWRQFRENYGDNKQRKWELCSASERAVPSEKSMKTALKSTDKRQRNACSNYLPPNEQRSGLGAWQTKT